MSDEKNKPEVKQDTSKLKRTTKYPPATKKKTEQDEENERLKNAYLELGPSQAHFEQGID